MSLPEEVSNYDTLSTEDAEFWVMKAQRSYNQAEKVLPIMWPKKDEAGKYTGRSIAVCFTTQCSTEQLRLLRDGIQELLDHQADMRAVKPKERVKTERWETQEVKV